jgi:hypothetical protein
MNWEFRSCKIMGIKQSTTERNENRVSPWQKIDCEFL